MNGKSTCFSFEIIINFPDCIDEFFPNPVYPLQILLRHSPPPQCKFFEIFSCPADSACQDIIFQNVHIVHVQYFDSTLQKTEHTFIREIRVYHFQNRAYEGYCRIQNQASLIIHKVGNIPRIEVVRQNPPITVHVSTDNCKIPVSHSLFHLPCNVIRYIFYFASRPVKSKKHDTSVIFHSFSARTEHLLFQMSKHRIIPESSVSAIQKYRFPGNPLQSGFSE